MSEQEPMRRRLAHWLSDQGRRLITLFGDIATATRQSPEFQYYRAGHIRVRMRLFASLLGVATPAWIAVDAWVIPDPAFSGLAALRLATGAVFLALAAFWPFHGDKVSARASVWVLAGIAAVFQAGSQWILGGTLTEPALIGFTTFPLFLMACLALFPLALTEGLVTLGIVFAGLVLGLAAEPVPTAAPLLGLGWMGVLMGGFTLVAQGAHLYVLLVLHRQATLDSLTGLLNRRAAFQQAQAEMDRANREGLSLLLIDVDRFKQINDKYGHPVGDEILVHLARLLQKVAGRTDLVARFGGEEFLVVLPEHDSEEAVAVAEALRKELIRRPARTREGALMLTVSAGVADWQGPEESLAELIQRADQALYQAKDEGRNTIVRAEPGPTG